MRLPTAVRTACTVTAVLCLGGAALAQDGGTGAAGPAADTVETTDAWAAFSLEFAEQLRQAGRIPDAAEEYGACAVLRPDDLDVVADTALMLLDHAAGIAHALDAGSPYVAMIKGLIQMGVQRGGVGDGRLAYVIGRLNLVEREYAKAYDMLREARDAGYDDEALAHWYFIAAVNLAPERMNAGYAQGVIGELTRLIEAQPDHPQIIEALVNLAAAHRRNSDHVKSLKILEDLAASYPQDHRVWSALGREHLDQSRLGDALAAYRKALALAGSNGDAYAQALASVAHVLYKLGHFEESEAAVRSFMELDSDSVAALHLLALLHRERGQTLEALKLLRRADRLAKDDPTVLTLLQQVLYERGEIEEADAVQKRRDATYREPGKASERDKDEAGGAAATPPDDARDE